MEKIERLPFHRAWRKGPIDREKHTSIYIAPVNTKFLIKMDWLTELTLSGSYQDDVRELAVYARETIQSAFYEAGVPVTIKPTETSIILEIAIVEVTPSRAFLNLIKAGGILSGQRGSVAIEARVRDGGTWEVIALFADREEGKASLLNVANLTWYTHAKKIIDDWAKQLVFIYLSGPDKTVRDTPDFTLLPW
jgi:hypothetical protein